jgi:hypothetical protein
MGIAKQEVFETAGPVLTLRIQRDKDTGAPKGFGFCEFRDVECAEAAIRILHNYEMNGRRLTVDHAHGNLDKSSAGPSIKGLAVRDSDQHATGGGTGDEMTDKVNNMSARQMYELIGQLQGHVVKDPEGAKALMSQNHLLCCQFLRMQERLGMLTGINLPPPPKRAAPAPSAAPVAMDPIRPAPFVQNQAQAPGMGTHSQTLSCLHTLNLCRAKHLLLAKHSKKYLERSLVACAIFWQAGMCLKFSLRTCCKLCLCMRPHPSRKSSIRCNSSCNNSSYSSRCTRRHTYIYNYT